TVLYWIQTCIQTVVSQNYDVPHTAAQPSCGVSEGAEHVTDLLTTEPSRVTARRAQTRDRLMAAAISIFAARGIIGASVEEICEAAGFTRGAFYSNFADKDALVLALLQADIAGQYAAAEQAISAMKSAPG